MSTTTMLWAYVTNPSLYKLPYYTVLDTAAFPHLFTQAQGQCKINYSCIPLKQPHLVVPGLFSTWPQINKWLSATSKPKQWLNLTHFQGLGSSFSFECYSYIYSSHLKLMYPLSNLQQPSTRVLQMLYLKRINIVSIDH